MKKVLRLFGLVIANLITLPWQLIEIAIFFLTDWTDEERKEIAEQCRTEFHATNQWVSKGRFYDDED